MLFILLAATITIASMISTMVSVHLMTILQARDIALAAAVALGAIVGPAQVGARADRDAHRPLSSSDLDDARRHDLRRPSASAPSGRGCRSFRPLSCFYGAGIGIESIARGTLPLVLFGAASYAAIMGRIAMPSFLAQAAAPSLGAVLMARLGPLGMLETLFAVAVANVILVLALLVVLPRARAARRGAIAAS